MRCYTQEEIAEEEGLEQRSVGQIIEKMAELPESLKPAANHLTDFKRPCYNVWRWKEKTSGPKQVISPRSERSPAYKCALPAAGLGLWLLPMVRYHTITELVHVNVVCGEIAGLR